MTDRKNWQTQLVIVVQSDDGDVVVTPIESLTPRIDSPHDVIDSTEDTNLGYIRRPIKFSWDISCLAVGDAVQQLTKLQLAGKEFSIQTQVQLEGSEDWSFWEDGMILENCVITGSGPSNIVNDGVARATFNGLSLGFQEGGITHTNYS
jgi:hypothetical protein